MAASYFLPAGGCNFGVERNIRGVDSWLCSGPSVVFLTLLMTRDSWALGWGAKGKRKKKRVKKVLINMKQDNGGPAVSHEQKTHVEKVSASSREGSAGLPCCFWPQIRDGRMQRLRVTNMRMEINDDSNHLVGTWAKHCAKSTDLISAHLHTSVIGKRFR